MPDIETQTPDALPSDGPRPGAAEPGPDIAVALRYDPHRAATPRVVASGRGAVAGQILAAAFAAGVRVREDADLVEILAAVDVDSEIPLEALAAVAEILSYVYRANGAPVPQAPPPADPGAAR